MPALLIFFNLQGFLFCKSTTILMSSHVSERLVSMIQAFYLHLPQPLNYPLKKIKLKGQYII